MEGGIWKFKWEKWRKGQGGRTEGRSEDRMEGRRKTGRKQGWMYIKIPTMHSDTCPKFFPAEITRGPGEIVAIRHHPGRPFLWALIAATDSLFWRHLQFDIRLTKMCRNLGPLAAIRVRKKGRPDWRRIGRDSPRKTRGSRTNRWELTGALSGP